MSVSIEQHNIEIKKNLEAWNKKPLLQKIYRGFYEEILGFVNENLDGEVVELGSGIGNFKTVYPKCITTDIFPNPWVDRVEDAYKLSFKDRSVSNLILFDVFHHLAYPGSALTEFKRVLADGGRVIIFDPYISLLGFLVYGLFHHEPVAMFDKINWINDENKNPNDKYYAAQGNATKIFNKVPNLKFQIPKGLKVIKIQKFSAISYILSGGFSRPSFYKIESLSKIKKIEKFLDKFPQLFATRILIILEKR